MSQLPWICFTYLPSKLSCSYTLLRCSGKARSPTQQRHSITIRSKYSGGKLTQTVPTLCSISPVPGLQMPAVTNWTKFSYAFICLSVWKQQQDQTGDTSSAVWVFIVISNNHDFYVSVMRAYPASIFDLRTLGKGLAAHVTFYTLQIVSAVLTGFQPAWQSLVSWTIWKGFPFFFLPSWMPGRWGIHGLGLLLRLGIRVPGTQSYLSYLSFRESHLTFCHSFLADKIEIKIAAWRVKTVEV